MVNHWVQGDKLKKNGADQANTRFKDSESVTGEEDGFYTGTAHEDVEHGEGASKFCCHRCRSIPECSFWLRKKGGGNYNIPTYCWAYKFPAEIPSHKGSHTKIPGPKTAKFYGNKWLFGDVLPAVASTGKTGSVNLDQVSSNFGKCHQKCAAAHVLFKLEDADAQLTGMCKNYCLANANCVAMSGIEGSWCTGCNKALTERHNLAVAYKKESGR